ncbi:MAG: patatin-like phospholipase family protein [Bacteroides sp.]|nr:patatin-like phospholipase family protein [Bacteroides sp.]
MKTKTKKRVALVIGSGAIKCAASIGMFQVLEEEGVDVDLVVGCSGGAIYGVGIAAGTSPEEIKALSDSTWTKDLMQDYLVNLKASKDGSLKFNERSGLVNDSYLNDKLRCIAGGRSFADLKTPLIVVATDMMDGEPVELSTGDIFSSVRASLAIPMIFPPWEIDGRLLVDGAASNPLPIDVAIQHGADIVLAMGFTVDYRSRFRSITAVQEQMTSIYMNNIFKNAYAFHNLAHHSEIFPIIPEFDSTISMFDIHKMPHIIERGKEATLEQLPHIKRLLEE